MLLAQKEELPKPVNQRTTFKITTKNNITMKLSGGMLSAFWISGYFNITTGKVFLGRHFHQLLGYFVPGQTTPLSGNGCNFRGKTMETLISQIGCLKAIQRTRETLNEANLILSGKL